jgi:hypothetical protein
MRDAELVEVVGVCESEDNWSQEDNCRVIGLG